MTKKLNVNHPISHYAHNLPVHACKCNNSRGLYCRVHWKKMEKDVDRHEQSPPFYTIQPFTRLKEQQIHTSTDSKPQAKCPYAEATAFLP